MVNNKVMATVLFQQNFFYARLRENSIRWFLQTATKSIQSKHSFQIHCKVMLCTVSIISCTFLWQRPHGSSKKHTDSGEEGADVFFCRMAV